MTDDNSNQKDPAAGCLIAIVVILVGLILAIFFPETREGLLAKPIIGIWQSLFGVPIPTYNIGPIILKSVFVLILTIFSFLVGITLAKYINKRFYGLYLNLQTIGAIASILGFLIGIVSLVLKK